MKRKQRGRCLCPSNSLAAPASITKGKEEVCFTASEKQRRMVQHIGRKGGLFPVKVFSIHWTQHSSKENIRQIAALDLQGKEILAD
ncbi:hypothetical protein Bca4012_004798 [Brassica carinata]